jgi:DGQHR domain-containing protein
MTTASATKTVSRSSKVASPAATKAASEAPTPAEATKPKPAPRVLANKLGTAGKKSKVTIESHFIPGKVAMATLTPDKLMELAFISTYSTQDPQSTSPRLNGYQREPMAERFPGIGRYYARDNNRNLITPLIASARLYEPQDQVRFNKLFAAGDMQTIHAEFGRSVFSIVDGQHRMGGLYWAWRTIEDFNADVPVMIYYGLHYTEEANLFDDINTSQRKLPRALIESTKVHMEAGSKSHDQFIREIAYALAQDGDSVWNDQVNMTGGKEERKRPVTMEGVRRSTGSMMDDRLISRLQDRKFDVKTVAKRYWQLVSKACSVAWNNQPRTVLDDEGFMVEEPVKYRLKDLVGLAALAKLGKDILTSALEKSTNEEEFYSVMADLISKLGQVDWEKRRDNPWMSGPAGFAGQDYLRDILWALVYMNKEPGEPVEP